MENMQAIGKARRDKAVSMAMKRKEEYLGARVPKTLRDRVIERAKELGIPVSILIRNTLEEAFKESVEDERVVSPVRSSDNKKIPESFSSVIGWELIQLNKTLDCSACGLRLQKGIKANIGLGSQQPVVICCACKESI